MLNHDKVFHPATGLALVSLFVALGGSAYAASKIGTSGLKNSAVTAAKLHANAVTTAKLGKFAVSAPKIKNGAVTSAALADATVATADLADAAVTAGKLATGAVGTSNLAAASVTSSKLADGSTTTSKLADGAVTTTKLADQSVVGAKIAAGTITASNIKSGEVLLGNGQMLFSRRVLGAATTKVALVALPNMGVIYANCSLNSISDTDLTNTGNATLDVQTSGVDSPGTTFLRQFSQLPGTDIGSANFGNGPQTIQYQMSYRDAQGNDHGATVWITSIIPAGGGCKFTAQALIAG